MWSCMYRLRYMIEFLCTILDFLRKLSILSFSFIGPSCKCIFWVLWSRVMRKTKLRDQLSIITVYMSPRNKCTGRLSVRLRLNSGWSYETFILLGAVGLDGTSLHAKCLNINRQHIIVISFLTNKINSTEVMRLG